MIETFAYFREMFRKFMIFLYSFNHFRPPFGPFFPNFQIESRKIALLYVMAQIWGKNIAIGQK